MKTKCFLLANNFFEQILKKLSFFNERTIFLTNDFTEQTILLNNHSVRKQTK